MLGAQPAIIRAAQLGLREWVFGMGWGFGAHPGAKGGLSAPDNNTEWPMFRAVFFEVHVFAALDARGGNPRRPDSRPSKPSAQPARPQLKRENKFVLKTSVRSFGGKSPRGGR